MIPRFVLRRDAAGFTVADGWTGEPVKIASHPQTGLSEADARHTADLLNRRAEPGDRAVVP